MQHQNYSFKNERYETIGELGRGGMGIVLRCRDNQLLRDVAVKILSRSTTSKEAVRFHKEAIALAKMKHPNILTILDFGQSEDNELFIVLELLTGENLSALIESSEEIPLEQKLSIFIQLCDGLAHAHRRGILHRDIKPSNIFIERTAGGELIPVITDFGLAKLLSEDQHLTKTGVGIGSPPYMSPEQANGNVVDERSDIYSLGCLMFEMLTEELPFLGTTVQQTLLMHVTEAVPKLSDKAPGKEFSLALEQMIARCLEKDPAQRYQTISELRAALIDYRTSLFADNQAAEIESSGVYRPAHEMFETMKSTPSSSSKPLILTICLALIVCVIIFCWFVTRTLENKSEEYKIQDGNQLVRVYDDHPSIDRALDVSTDWRSIQGQDWKKKFDELRKSSLIEYQKIDLLPMCIDANDTGLTDEDLNSIRFIPLGGLRAIGTKITDRGLESLKGESSLREIYLSNTRVTDEGLSNLANLPHLTYIYLDDTAVTDDTIKFLSTCPEISTISLKLCSGVKGTSLEALARPQVYTGINLAYTNTAPKNLKKLKGLRVEGLDFAGLHLNDANLEDIAEIQNVKVLTIRDNPRITGKGLLKLKGMPKLETLYADPSIDFKEFREHRPDVHINP